MALNPLNQISTLLNQISTLLNQISTLLNQISTLLNLLNPLNQISTLLNPSSTKSQPFSTLLNPLKTSQPNPPITRIFAVMIAIDDVLLSDQIITDQFVCDLNSCKGACCVDGDAGAPLDAKELKEVDAVFDKVLPYLRKEGVDEIAKQGRYVYDKEFGWVTPTIKSKICVYGIFDSNGIVKCGIEQAYLDGKTNWKKPISCHLFPVIVKKSTDTNTQYANYEPREDHCKAACSLGNKLKVPVYQFLKEPLIRKFGTSFYEALHATAVHLNTKK